MRSKILELMEKNNHLTPAEIAVMIDASEEAVEAEIAAMEEDKTILGYHTPDQLGENGSRTGDGAY